VNLTKVNNHLDYVINICIKVYIEISRLYRNNISAPFTSPYKETLKKTYVKEKI